MKKKLTINCSNFFIEQLGGTPPTAAVGMLTALGDIVQSSATFLMLTLFAVSKCYFHIYDIQ